LLRLPAELRNAIYEHALTVETIYCTVPRTHDANIVHTVYYSTHPNDRFVHLHNTQRLREVCRQVRVETAGMKYSYNYLMMYTILLKSEVDWPPNPI
jgi:hypothetical protein